MFYHCVCVFPCTICFQTSHSISFLGENLASAHHLGSDWSRREAVFPPKQTRTALAGGFPIIWGEAALKPSLPGEPTGQPSWSEATHVLYPKPGAWPATSVQACTEETETQQLIHFSPTKLMCGEETPPHSGHQSHLQSGVTAKKIGSTSSGILLSVFMSLGGVLSIQTRTVAFQDHLADLGQLWSWEKYFPPVIFMMAVNLSS